MLAECIDKSRVLDRNNKINYNFLREPGFSIPAINLKHLLFGLSDAKRGILDYIFCMLPRQNGIFSSQAHIADNVGITREWTNKCIKDLVSLGLLKKIYRHRKTCIYMVPEKLFAAKNIKWLVRLFPSIYKLLTTNFTPNYKYLNYLNMKKLSIQILSQLGLNMFGEENNKVENSYEFIDSVKNGTKLDIKALINFRGLTKCLGVFCLTQHGIIKLMGYSNEVLLEALKVYEETDMSLFDDYFEQFTVICDRISHINNLKVDHFLVNCLKSMYGITHFGLTIGNSQHDSKITSFLEANGIARNHKREVNKQFNNRPARKGYKQVNEIRSMDDVCAKILTYSPVTLEHVKADTERLDRELQTEFGIVLEKTKPHLHLWTHQLKMARLKDEVASEIYRVGTALIAGHASMYLTLRTVLIRYMISKGIDDPWEDARTSFYRAKLMAVLALRTIFAEGLHVVTLDILAICEKLLK